MTKRMLPLVEPLGQRQPCRPRHARAVRWTLAMLLVCSLSAVTARGQDEPVATWDFSPYRIQVWLSVEPRGALPSVQRDEIAHTIIDFAGPAAGVTWDVEVVEPPAYLRAEVTRSLESFNADMIVNSDLVLVVNKESNKREDMGLKRADDLFRFASGSETAVESVKSGVRIGLADPQANLLGSRTVQALGDAKAKLLHSHSGRVLGENSKRLVEQVLAGELDAAVCYRGDTLEHLKDLLSFELRAAGDSRDILAHDKLIFINIQHDLRGLTVQAREMDGPMRHLGPIGTYSVRQPELLAHVCASAMAEAFSPVARIEERVRSDEELAAEKEKGRRNVIDARVRAGGLIRRPECLSHIEPGDVLLPIVRRNDKYGNPTVLESVAWTFLQVVGRDAAMLDCDVQSGTRGGIAARRSARTQQVGIKAKPRPGGTTVYMTSRATPSGSDKRPMIGYEIHNKDLKNDEMELIGYSDWRGAFDVEPDPDNMLRLLYVKNGSVVLAKLPVVPGLFEELRMEMNDDERRLEAEAFVKSVQTTILDTVAQTKVLELRLRKAMDEKKVDEVKALVTDLMALPTRDGLTAVMNEREQQLKSGNPITQKKIDLLLKDTRELMARYIDMRARTDLIQQAEQMTGGA
ncbi:MAG: hypothetical protein R3C99_10705 [Pirellulaceae bacterium]